MRECTLNTSSPEATETIAVVLAESLESETVLFLEGDLGAGKTTFTRGLARGLLLPEPRDVASPTYAIHHRYEGGRLPIDHLDLYRIDDPLEAERQGLFEPLTAPDGLTVVEWSERLPPGFITPQITVHLTYLAEDARRLVVRAEDRVLTTLKGIA